MQIPSENTNGKRPPKLGITPLLLEQIAYGGFTTTILWPALCPQAPPWLLLALAELNLQDSPHLDSLTSTKSNSRTCSDGATGEPSAHLHITSALRVPRLPERWHLATCEATKHHINSMLSHQKSWSRWSLMCSRAMLLFLKNSRQKNVSAGFLGLLTNKFHVFILSCLA